MKHISNLSKLGMQKKWIYEGILEASNHFSAMGFWTTDSNSVKIRAYFGSNAHFLLSKGKAQATALHFPISAGDFFLINKPENLGRALKRLPSVSLELLSVQKKRGFSIFTFRPIFGQGMKNFNGLISRAPMLSLECLICHSRGKGFSEKLSAIRRIAPNSVFSREIAKLLRKKKAKKKSNPLRK